jgi:hypothetical protein
VQLNLVKVEDGALSANSGTNEEWQKSIMHDTVVPWDSYHVRDCNMDGFVQRSKEDIPC